MYHFNPVLTDIQSPSLGGIPHDVYGMTSLSVREFVKGIYRKLNINPAEMRKMQASLLHSLFNHIPSKLASDWWSRRRSWIK